MDDTSGPSDMDGRRVCKRADGVTVTTPPRGAMESQDYSPGELEYLRRIGEDWQAGRLTMDCMAAAYRRYKAIYDKPRFSFRWNTVMPVPSEQLGGRPRLTLDDLSPDGCWTWDGSGPQPATGGTPVVYMLFDEDALIYIGATCCLSQRLRGHRGTKRFTSWMAWPFQSKDSAFCAESQWITAYQPPLNGPQHVPPKRTGEVWPPPVDVVQVRR